MGQVTAICYRGLRLNGELGWYDDIGDGAGAREVGRRRQRVVDSKRVLLAHAHCRREADDRQGRWLDGAERHLVELILTSLLIQECHLYTTPAPTHQHVCLSTCISQKPHSQTSRNPLYT